VSSNNGNGNGDRPHARTALETVKEAIEARQVEEATTGVLSVEETGMPSSIDDDPVYAWKKRSSGDPVTLEVLHDGLIAVSQIAEAAIENGIKIGVNLANISPTIHRNATQIDMLAAKVEANASHINQVDDELARNTEVLNSLRRDVQFMRDDLRQIKGHVESIPAIKDMLGEILARLPDTK
jgi:hypothetical protein